jgi:membrane protease YdiL (CAAX protease family)
MKSITRTLALFLLFGLIEEIRWALALLPGAKAWEAASPYEWTVIWKTVQVALVLLTSWSICRMSAQRIEEALGVREPGRGLFWGALCAAPAWIGFLLLGRLRGDVDPWVLTMTAFASPVSEELLYRALLFKQLVDFSGWKPVPALLVGSAPFVLGHLNQARASPSLAKIALAALLAYAGAVLAGWMFWRWRWNLWVPFAFHVTLNSFAYLFWEHGNLASGGMTAALLVAAGAWTVAVTSAANRTLRPVPESTAPPESA